MCFDTFEQEIALGTVGCDVSEKARAAAPDAQALVQGAAPLRKDDRVIVHLRANWTIEGRFHAMKNGAVRIFDPAVRDVLQLHAEDIAVIRRVKDAS